ncbi:MAG: J domain-containing protein [Nitrospinaceae bacterium]|jgi:DnaJ-domain-containing protein 1|nr:J domain-containing protein [Nitrospinaceae bacterium]MBT5868786.1 J domain-containing protein [Nitrospinaceae bacterium]MBT6345491.1 J domain-containing protein [Nitrospina sp.]
MIKRLYNIARAELSDLTQKNKETDAAEFFDANQGEQSVHTPEDPLAKFYANLEIPVGSDRATIKNAWKTQMKKYHPDLHGADPKKQQIAEELTRQLTQAYRALDSAFLKK